MSGLLDVKGVSKAYGGTQALRAVDLAVEEGTIHGIVGPNGAGKSTLMKIIAGHVARETA
jgi:ABC-type sugar transport system ATPase subunit